MMDTIYEMVGWAKYLTTLGSTFERYNTNSIGKKILLFPILLICVVLLIVITPFLMVGCLLRLVFIFIDWVNDALEDETIWRYGLDCTAFLNFFIAIFITYGIMYLLYLLHRGLNFILGKTITENYEEETYLNFESNKIQDNTHEKKEENPSNIYVIDDETYK